MDTLITVTFDHNTYENVVSPEKCNDKQSVILYSAIHQAIKDGLLSPFISETILTIETLSRDDRKDILSSKDRFAIEITENTGLKNEIGYSLYLGPNPSAYPDQADYFYKYLPKAIGLGFKILPNYRLGKLSNPSVNNSWNYHPPNANYMEVPDRFGTIVSLIEEKGLGFAQVLKLVSYQLDSKKPWIDFLREYEGGLRKLQRVIAEWSDADSVAIHIASGIQYFCTLDGTGKTDKDSILGKSQKNWLSVEFGVKFVTPIELLNLLKKS